MDIPSAAAALAALAQRSRLATLRLLTTRGADGANAGEIAQHLGINPAVLSFHLKELVRANLVYAEPYGRFIRYRAEVGKMQALLDFLTQSARATQGDRSLFSHGESDATST